MKFYCTTAPELPRCGNIDRVRGSGGAAAFVSVSVVAYLNGVFSLKVYFPQIFSDKLEETK
jgi:hypothetical protein